MKLTDAQATAGLHWGDRPGGLVMVSMARTCVAILGEARKVETLGSADAVKLLKGLRDRGLSPKSTSSYYGAFKRMVALVDGPSTAPWPKAPTVPRVRSRERLEAGDLDTLLQWLRGKGWTDTADLGVLMRGTGMRIKVEGLTEAHCVYVEGEDYGLLKLTGKGGHERPIPVVDTACRALLGDKTRLADIRKTSYETHLDRWNKGVRACGIKSKLATPHAVRHGYASDVLRKSGGDIAMVQQLLGHADPATTARYLHVDLAAKAKVLSS